MLMDDAIKAWFFRSRCDMGINSIDMCVQTDQELEEESKKLLDG